MILKFKFLLFITLAIQFMGCECPVNVDDEDKTVKPTEYGNMLFINAMPETHLNKLLALQFSNEPSLERIDTLLYNPELQSINRYKKYKPLGLRFNNRQNTLRIIRSEDSTLLFNSPLNIEKNGAYTFIAFGKDNSLQSIVMNDHIENPAVHNIYFRCVNVSPDAPEIHFTVITEAYSKEFSLKSGQSSDIAAAPSGDYSIKMTSVDSSIVDLTVSGFDLSQGKINNIIFRGYYWKQHENRRGIIVVTGDYPFK